MQEWCLEYKNVEYYSFFLKVLNGEIKWRRNSKPKLEKAHREK